MLKIILAGINLVLCGFNMGWIIAILISERKWFSFLWINAGCIIINGTIGVTNLVKV